MRHFMQLYVKTNLAKKGPITSSRYNGWSAIPQGSADIPNTLIFPKSNSAVGLHEGPRFQHYDKTPNGSIPIPKLPKTGTVL
ncbi:uncharacterized protein PADG_11834 [Paracoccidioides brasiliensis Pb18]|uniref:Uncharacterized protein n=1 Tax=Paracoccidioides brasiliensis (strain Pb18) TaxID=502780 RepID=A0A0A0HUL3_PARBD|nr:uncharacterized protein PADG_11834 [Paracoccidioides brasiliensis Pb18]KGM92043.1 hypothetical protein PADG_11834 [Paracoccidioides brasiliensis Pb18]